MILAKALGGVTSSVPSTKGISDYEADYHFMLAKAHNDSTRQTSKLFSAIKKNSNPRSIMNKVYTVTL